MSNEFSTKKIICKDQNVLSTIERVRLEWLKKFLLRFKVDPDKIERALNDPKFLNEDWRDYLLLRFEAEIIFDMANKGVIVSKYHKKTNKVIKLAEWKKPEIVRVRTSMERHCELHLKYWSLI